MAANWSAVFPGEPPPGRLESTVKRVAWELADAHQALAVTETATRDADQARLEQLVRERRADIAQLVADVGGAQLPSGPAATLPWDDKGWREFNAPSFKDTVEVPALYRIGQLSDLVPFGGRRGLELDQPAVVPVFGDSSILFSGAGAQLDAARGALQSLVLRLVASLPPGRVRLTLADHPNKGQSFATLLRLHRNLMGDRVIHEPKDIDEALRELIEHVSMVIQKHLTSQYADIEQYNAAAEVPEPYRVLGVADFPHGFTKDSADRVLSLARTGRRTGVYVAMTIDQKAELPRGFNLEELYRACRLVVQRANDDFQLNVDGVSRAPVKLDAPPDRELADAIVRNITQGAGRIEEVKVELMSILAEAFRWPRPVPPDVLWGESTMGGLSSPIGRRGARDVQLFQLGQAQGTAHHGLVCGMTGLGKTVLLHSLILGLSHVYSPEELELALVDFKEGVEFEPYRRLPHATVVAIESEREFGLSLLEGMRDEMNRRGALFKQTGVNTFADYRAGGRNLPRVLAIIDEFQLFFERSDHIASIAKALLDDIARRGRGFGVHLLLSSQTLGSTAGDELETTTLAQLGLRVALKLSETDSNKVLGRDNPAAASLERPGEAIYNDKAGMIAANNRFRAAWMSPEDRLAALDTLEKKAGAQFPRRPRIFEGNKPAHASDNPDLQALRATRPTTTPRVTRLFLGEPANMAVSHVSFRLRPQSRSNLLILGQAEPDTLAVFLAAGLGFALTQPRGAVTSEFLNLMNVDDPLHDFVADLDGLGGIRVGGRRNIVAAIDRVYAELTARLANADEQRTARAPVLLGIFGLQRARDLHREGITTPDATKKLSKLLKEGPDLGVHVLLAADTYSGAMRVLDAKDINEFDGRVALAGADSGKILGEHGSGLKLKARFGVLWEPEYAEVTHKFKVYDRESLVSWYREALAGTAAQKGNA